VSIANNKHQIVLLHGFLSSSSYWKKLTPYLHNAGYDVIPIDLLGFGTAPKPHDAAYDYDTHLAYIDSVLTVLKVNTPFIMVGHSMGALLAARYARTYETKVSEAILLNPPLYVDSTQAYTTLRETNLMYRLLLDSRYRRVGWVLLRLSAFRFIKSHSHRSRELSLENIIQNPYILNDLADTRTRTLVLVGTKDRQIYRDNLLALVKNPFVTVSVEEVNHHSPMRSSKLVQRMILDFLDTK